MALHPGWARLTGSAGCAAASALGLDPVIWSDWGLTLKPAGYLTQLNPGMGTARGPNLGPAGPRHGTGWARHLRPLGWARQLGPDPVFGSAWKRTLDQTL